jgi:hypothetical protein
MVQQFSAGASLQRRNKASSDKASHEHMGPHLATPVQSDATQKLLPNLFPVGNWLLFYKHCCFSELLVSSYTFSITYFLFRSW